MKRSSRQFGRRDGKALRGAESELEALETMEDVLTDFSIEELREFLEADLVQVDVDPEFRERLREQLWAIVQSRKPGSDDGH